MATHAWALGLEFLILSLNPRLACGARIMTGFLWRPDIEFETDTCCYISVEDSVARTACVNYAVANDYYQTDKELRLPPPA
jgi:hypothetical protein